MHHSRIVICLCQDPWRPFQLSSLTRASPGFARTLRRSETSETTPTLATGEEARGHSTRQHKNLRAILALLGGAEGAGG
jgi:hypothetical protein